jgi:hypothetical protein
MTASSGREAAASVNLSISIFNEAKVADSVLFRGEARARQILAQAGIRVTWLTCGSRLAGEDESENRNVNPCLGMTFPEHLSVRVMTRPLAATEDTFGQSFLDEAGQGCYADVYHGNFALLSSRALLSDAEILGHVIAHEVGHLLLGANSHSAVGVMRAHWDREELEQASRGSLRFTPAQATMMRERLNASSAISSMKAVEARSSSSAQCWK